MKTLEHFFNKSKLVLGNSMPPNALRNHYAKEIPKAIVIEKLKLAYVPIPKAANRSIKTALANSINLKFEVSAHRANWKTIAVEKLPLTGYFVFTTVRNPIDRLVSCYKQKFLHPNRDPNRVFWKYGRAIKADFSFEDFAEFVIQTPNKYSDRHFQSQCTLLGNNLAIYDKIIRFENLEKEWEVMQQNHKLGSLPRTNASKHLGESFEVSEELKERLFLRYKNDFEAFNFNLE